MSSDKEKNNIVVVFIIALLLLVGLLIIFRVVKGLYEMFSKMWKEEPTMILLLIGSLIGVFLLFYFKRKEED